MAEGSWSVARVAKLTAAGVQKNERHNERKNESYANMNVDLERSPLNVHFKDTGGLTYNEYFQKLIDEGKISTRGLRENATLFNEMIVDVNTKYFEERGGYEYARTFYEEAYRFACGIYGEENIISAVMHADEINKAVTEELGKPVYHYHLHSVAIPTVRKEIRWSKRCKDEALRGTVKEVINQVSHSKKWESKVPELDENGQVVRNEKGKTVFRKSYSVLQDKLFEHLTAAGFTGFERGELGSTAENLKSLDFQIEKDKERLAQTEQKVNKAKKELAEIRGEVRTKQKVAATYGEIDALGSKGITGKYTVTKQELDSLKALAKEGVSSRSEIHDLKRSVSYYQRQAMDLSSRLSNVKERLKEVTEKYERLVEITKPYLMALQHFPDKVKEFFERLFPQKERAEEREAPKPARKPKMRDDWAR